MHTCRPAAFGGLPKAWPAKTAIRSQYAISACRIDVMNSMQHSLKDQLRADLTAAMKARDELTVGALRQGLSAISVAETAGAEAVVLSDDAVLAVLVAESRKHHETADAFDSAGRPDKAARERAEAAVLEAYVPPALGVDELRQLVAREVESAAADGVTGMKAMGRVVAAVRSHAGPAADGAQIAALVKSALG
jgi:uncharacterized protein